jgi:uncharacterized protein
MKRKNIEAAINELKKRVLKKLGVDAEMRLFGSVARRDYKQNSDIDVLVLVPGSVNNSLEEEIFDLAYDIELKYSVVFGIVVYQKEFWYSELGKSMPLHKNVQRDGVSL